MTTPPYRASPELTALLAEGVRDGVFPGAVVMVGKLAAQGSRALVAHAGRRTPATAPVLRTTPYDLASLTKPFVAALALRLAQHGALDLHAPVASILPELAGTHAGEQTLAALLSHRAGLSPWRALDAALPHPPGSAEARAHMLHLAATGVAAEPAPAGASVYSDLGYIVAGAVLARAGGAPLAVLLRREVTLPLGLDRAVFYPPALAEAVRARFREVVAPTEVLGRRDGLICGEVHDDNAYALGGVAGHAGLFGSAAAVCAFGLGMLAAHEGRSRWLDQALVRWALAPRGPGHLVGWDTPSSEASSAGSRCSTQAFGHLGFTGTSIWCDPPRRLCMVLLSNRVHPTRDNVAIRAFRPRFHDAVAQLLDAGALTEP